MDCDDGFGSFVGSEACTRCFPENGTNAFRLEVDGNLSPLGGTNVTVAGSFPDPPLWKVCGSVWSAVGVTSRIWKVEVNGRDCESFEWSHSQIRCAAPEGIGAGAILRVSGHGIWRDFTVDYESLPPISSISPSSSWDVDGGEEVDVEMGALVEHLISRGIVARHSLVAGPFSASWADNAWVTPAGLAGNHSVSVCVVDAENATIVACTAKSSEAPNISYALLSIEAVDPDFDLDPFGGDTIYVHGTNFGSSENRELLDISVLLNGNECLNLHHRENGVIECLTPLLEQREVSVQVSAADMTSIALEARTMPVGITGIIPRRVMPAALQTHTLDFALQLFGADLLQRAYIGGVECPRLLHLKEDVVLCADLQVPPRWATEDVWLVAENRNLSRRPSLRSEPPPRIVSLEAPGGNLPTQGGVRVTVVGVGFGITDEDISALIFRDSESPGSMAVFPRVPYLNISLSRFGASSVEVLLPSGVGTSHSIELRTAYGLISPPFPFSYDAPVVLQVEPARVLPGIVHQSITLRGHDLGLKPDDVDFVTIGGRACADVTAVSGTVLKCTGLQTPSGPDDGWLDDDVRVSVGGQVAVFSGLVDLVPVPRIDAVIPVGAEAPTPIVPGDEIDLFGDGFGASQHDIRFVRVAGTRCVSIRFLSQQNVRCTLPNPHPFWEAANPDTVYPTVPVVIKLSSGIASQPANVVPGGGVRIRPPPQAEPEGVVAWRMVGDAGDLVVRWRFPNDGNETVVYPGEVAAAAPAESFAVTVVSSNISNTTWWFPRTSTLLKPASPETSTDRSSDHYWELHQITLPLQTNLPVLVTVAPTNADGIGIHAQANHPRGLRLPHLPLDQLWIPATCSMDSFLHSNPSKCSNCPAGAVCGGLPSENMTALDGFWRVPWATYHFLPCLSESRCLGFPESALPLISLPQHSLNRTLLATLPLAARWAAEDDYDRPVGSIPGNHREGCAPGTSGVFCSGCEKGRGESIFTGTCEPCPDDAAQAATGVTLIVVSIVFLSIFLLFVDQSSGREVTPASRDHVTFPWTPLELLISHFQSLYLLSAIVVPWSTSGRALFALSSASFPLTGNFGFECLIHSPEERILLREGLTIYALPVLAVGFAAGFWAVVARCNCQAPCIRPEKSFLDRFIPALVMLATLLHTPLTNSALRLLGCELVAGRWLLSADMNVECSSANAPARIAMAAIPLVAFSLGLPAFFLYLACTKLHLPPPTFSRWFGAVFDDLRTPTWAIAPILFRSSIAITSTFLRPAGPYAQISALLCLFLVYVALHARVRPAHDDSGNLIELGSLVTLSLTLVSALGHLSATHRTRFSVASTIILIIPNTILVIYCLRLVGVYAANKTRRHRAAFCTRNAAATSSRKPITASQPATTPPYAPTSSPRPSQPLVV